MVCFSTQAILERARRLYHVPELERDAFREVIKETWHLGFTSFGGTCVQFRTFHQKFVEDLKWIEESLYQELFALFQALPGSASTKMIVTFMWIHGGLRAGIVTFVLWCLPSSVGMFGLALSVSHIGDKLPGPVYALLSGINSATVGIIAAAALQLSRNAITDKLTRLLVLLGGAAGMLYSSIWYFPVLMFTAGVTTMLWDGGWLQLASRRLKARVKQPIITENSVVDVELAQPQECVREGGQRSMEGPASVRTADVSSVNSTTGIKTEIALVSWRTGVYLTCSFAAFFLIIVLLRLLLKHPAHSVSLFSNFFLAGCLIIGGGPVSVTLLNVYIVNEGWVSPRNFLLGVAFIEAFPGPNFSLAVYLGALANPASPIAGALIGFTGMFLPGMWVSSGFLGIWAHLRAQEWLNSLLRGINALAIGLIYCAVYRLWHVGLLNENNPHGTTLGSDPWWIAITATTFVLTSSFGLKVPFAILLGAVMGIFWWAIVRH